MMNVDFSRDLVVTGVIFGVAAFVWAGWAQERPPGAIAWRFVLAVIQVAGLVLVGFSITAVMGNWNTATAIDPGSAAFVGYVIVFWIEIIALVLLAVYLIRTKRSQLIAPTVMIIVGLHFVPLTFVFDQPIIMVAAVLITAAGVVALFLPSKVAAPSFWCGIVAGPIFVALGTAALIVGVAAQ